MAQALALSARTNGSTAPNPRVGCVLVRDGVAVGTGLHHGPGNPHAEDLAVASAGDAARGATVYVTLEPCAHQGKTPPCADRLISAGVARVVAALGDPDPRVDGKGFALLEQAGIQVESGLLGQQAERLNAAFLHRHRSGMPLVTLKAALSLDGQLSAVGGESRWISCATARRVSHRLRLDHDAVLVGAGTVRRDDPRLTVRLDGREERPLSVILSRSLELDATARLLSPPDPVGVIVYTGESSSVESATTLAKRATVVRVGEDAAGLKLDEVLKDLAARGAQSVLVEGGGRTLHGFLSAGLAGRGALFHAPLTIGARGATPLIDGVAVDAPASGWRFERERVLALGCDQWTVGRWIAPQGTA